MYLLRGCDSARQDEGIGRGTGQRLLSSEDRYTAIFKNIRQNFFLKGLIQITDARRGIWAAIYIVLTSAFIMY